jgi:hypothetical protein
VEEVTIKRWSLFAGIKASSRVSPSFGDTAEGSITGVCGVERSRADRIVPVVTSTADGNVSKVCE